ncbi:MAG: HEAT repeat domain-containing protein [Candidatus Omnitrophica bacterium]|nr:HEAT repeat domain-containing protein [Candidatus Omnitrophota bacterium]
MNTIKNHRFFKIICFALVITFISLDISYAYPAEHTAQNSTLATPSVFQTQPITTHAEAFQRSMLADGNLLGTVCSIGKFLLEDGIKLRHLARVLGEELGDAAKYVDLSRVSVTIMYDGRLVKLDPSLSVDTPQSAVVLIPYNKDGKNGIIEIALKNNPFIDKLAGYQWVVSDKYVIKDLPADYKEPALRPAPEVKTEAPVQPTISGPIARVEAPTTEAEKSKGILTRVFSIRAITTFTLAIILLFTQTALAASGDSTNLFSSSNMFRLVTGIAVLITVYHFAKKRLMLAKAQAIINEIGTLVSMRTEFSKVYVVDNPGQALFSIGTKSGEMPDMWNSALFINASIIRQMRFIWLWDNHNDLIRQIMSVDLYQRAVSVNESESIDSSLKTQGYAGRDDPNAKNAYFSEINKRAYSKVGPRGVALEAWFYQIYSDPLYAIKHANRDWIASEVGIYLAKRYLWMNNRQIKEVIKEIFKINEYFFNPKKSKSITFKSINPFAAIFGIAALNSTFSVVKDFIFAITKDNVIDAAMIGTTLVLSISVWRSDFPVSWHLFWARFTKISNAHINALIKMDRMAVPDLIKNVLGSKNRGTRWLALYILGEIGPVTPEVIPAFVKALGDSDSGIRALAADLIIEADDIRLSFMRDYLKMVRYAKDEGDRYYEVLNREEINYIVECLNNNMAIKGQYISHVLSNGSLAKLIINMNAPVVPTAKGTEQKLGAAELKSKWSEKMKSADEIGIKVNIGQLDEITATKKEINGIEYFESNTHNMKVSGDNRWHREDAVVCSFDAAEFNFTKLYEDVKPRHLIDEIKLENDDWYIGMDYMPILKYHMIIAPKQARQQLATPKDMADMQQFLAQMGDEKATLLHNSLLAGAGINSLHYHLFFYDFPIFKEGFPIYRGTEKFNTKTFTGKNCAQEAGAYLEELQGANQPYNLVMRYEKIIIIPRPRDIEFGYGADALAGVVFYGNDRSLEAATWYKPELMQVSNAAQLFEIVESSLNSRMAQFIKAGNNLINLANTRMALEGRPSIGNLDQRMTTAGIIQKVEWAIESLDKEGIAPEIKSAVESLKKNLTQFEADSTVGSLIVLARRAKREDQKLIIGLETDWIPGMNIKDSCQKQAIFALMKEIDSIGDALKSMRLDNVEIIRGSGKELADTLLDKAGKTRTNLHNVVVMASSDTINSENFAKLRNVDDNDRPFLAGIDPKDLIKFYSEYGESTSNQLYVKLTQLLYMTLELASGKEPMYTPIIDSYDRKMRIVIFMPRAEAKDYEALKNTYAAEKTALMAA